jgi:iron complex outermembrane receptor protein
MKTILTCCLFILFAGRLTAQDSLQKASFSRELSGITVISSKPLVEKKQDRIIINVEKMITASAGTAMDLLGKLPGISVSQDGAIRYNNKPGVLVLIDNKPTYLSGSELANLLQNMSGNEIESVEIIPNPPARYDAAGSAGILNIRTKKGLKRGTNGSITAGYSQGILPRENIALNLNSRNERWNFFGGLTAQNQYNETRQSNDRTFTGEWRDQHINALGNISRHSRSGGLQFGADHYISKKSTLGILVNANQLNMDISSHTVTDLLTGDSLTDRLRTNTAYDYNRRRITGNLNFKQTFRRPGQELSADLDYVYYHSTAHQDIHTGFFNPGNQETGSPLQLRSAAPVAINIWSARIDYTHPLGEYMRLEAGIKSNDVSNKNQVDYQRLHNGKWIADARTNEFVYKERINAAYINYAATFGKLSVQAGIRAEHTHGDGQQQRGDLHVTRDTLNFFPTLFVNYQLAEKHSIGVNYARRIERPQYELLNPFIVMLDTLTAEQGNPALRPQYVNTYGLTYTYNKAWILSLEYNATNDVMSNIVRQAPGEKITIFMVENISRLRTASAAITYNALLTSWWQASYYAAVIHTRYKGMASGSGVSLNNTAFNANITNSFQWKQGWSFEVSAVYNGRYLNEALGVAQPIFGLNAGVAKSLWENKAKIQLSVSDLTRPTYNMHAQYSNINFRNSYLGDSRRVGLTFTWKFGKATVEKARERTTGTKMEENRLKN